MRSLGADCGGERRRRKSCIPARGPEIQKCSSRGSSFGRFALSMSILRLEDPTAGQCGERAEVAVDHFDRDRSVDANRRWPRSVTPGGEASKHSRGSRMGSGHIAEVANLVGDPARANILATLLDNRARTASELAYAAGVSPQTASSHLG